MAGTDTPLMRQYLEIKAQYPDVLLLFRLGDFYELFFEDAKTAAKILEIALTSRNKNDPDPIMMCGVPYHSITSYIHKLINAGHKVALCEQMEEPSAGKGIVRREVVRVISPGTQLDLEAMEAKAPQYTHAAWKGPLENILWATCDYSTGRFWFGACANIQAWLHLAKSFQLKELLFAESDEGNALLRLWKEHAPHVFAQTRPAFYFDLAYASDRIKEQFSSGSLDAVHPRLGEMARPAGALIKYFQETQKTARVPSVQKMELWGDDGAMDLDPATIRSLELLPSREARSSNAGDASLLSWIDRTQSAMGGRLLREWLTRPLVHAQAIEARLENTQQMIAVAKALQPCLREIYDIERLLSRVGIGTANARDLRAISLSVLKASEMAPILEKRALGHALHAALSTEFVQFCNLLQNALVDQPPLTIREGALFKKGYHADLDELIHLSENGEQWLAAYEAKERQNTSITSLKVRFNNVFGYYIEVTKSNLHLVPLNYVRKQTTANGERFITEELKGFEEKILTAEKKRHDLEYALFKELCTRTVSYAAAFTQVAHAVASIDVHSAFALVAEQENYVRPTLSADTALDITEGWHPTVEPMLRSHAPHARFVPNSTQLSQAQKFLLITGPNMGGKSTVMRQTALIVLLAQMGSFVPARAAHIGIVDRVFTRIGAHDNIAEGASTFMVEMSEMSYILRNATPKSLVLIDEIGRGTSTYDGMSLAWALAKDIALRVQSRTLFSTHYHELTELESKLSGVVNMRMGVELGQDDDGNALVRFMYRLEPGAAEQSYGIQVARLAGLPENVLIDAQFILEKLENNTPEAPEENAKKAVPRKAVTSSTSQLTFF